MTEAPWDAAVLAGATATLAISAVHALFARARRSRSRLSGPVPTDAPDQDIRDRTPCARLEHPEPDASGPDDEPARAGGPNGPLTILSRPDHRPTTATSDPLRRAHVLPGGTRAARRPAS